MSTHTSGLCLEVEESLSDILEGTAAARLYDHIAECDACRDKRHDADLAVEAIEASGADFRAPEGFDERLLAAVIEARPNGPSSLGQQSLHTHGPIGESGPFPRVSVDAVAATGFAATELAPSVATPDATSSDRTILKAPTMLGEEPKGNATIIEPTKPSEPDATVARPSDVFVPSHKTIPLAAVASTLAEARASLAAPQPTPAPGSNPLASSPVVAAVTGNVVTGSGSSALPTPHGPATHASAQQAQLESAIDLAARKPGPQIEPLHATPATKQATPVRAQGTNVVTLFKRPGFIATLAGGMAAAAAAGYFWLGQPKNGDAPTDATAFVEGAWSGSVGSVSRASADGSQSGFEACSPEKCWPVAQGGAIKPGTTLKTDAKTRAKVTLVDGTDLFLDRNSEVSFSAGSTREAKVTRGLVVADVAKADKAAPAKFSLPQGQVEVIGTKLAITATDKRATVEVLRGEVRVKNDSTKWASVRAGEEAILPADGAPSVVAKQSMSDVLEWSDKDPEDVDAAALRGVGELKARKPGEANERTGAVTLTKHSTKVRVVDVVARTEIDETFTNHTDDVLEGIFRFPLPPGAQIEKLELEVEGKLISGAFVDRERAAAIWRGVLINAGGDKPKPREEIVWVPGPWRDPALLEWQRGGRFELKIFPIPKKGSRRVVLTYTQTVPQAGGIRKFSYPLAHDGSGTTKIDDFSMDVQVLGHDKTFGVTTRGYDLRAGDAPAGADRFRLEEKSFVPAGDLTVEYALPNRNAELTAWAFEPPAGTATPTTAQTLAASGAPPTVTEAANATLSKSQREKIAQEQAAKLATDTSPYVAISLRPNLPRFGEGKERLHVIVVDSSRSMIGERFARAKRLAASMVKEMDRRDSFMLMACDITCQGLGATAGRPLPEAREPSAEASQDVERFLGSIEPDGGSNLFASVQAAKTASGFARGKELRIIYLGDGTPTVGPTRPASLEAAIKHALPEGEGSIVSVALGTDADTATLGAMARGGGGVMVPYVPGQRVSAAAFDVLNAAYGTVLSDVSVELPPGLTEVTPAAMDPIAAGGEAFVFARMSGNREIEGNIKVRGRVGNERFEQSYPASIKASSDAGNGFVPRLFAAAKINDLERSSRIEDRERAIALSQRFAVATRFTSLLVLESDAMFKAFGLDRNAIDSTFSGEVAAQSTSSDISGNAELADKSDAKGKNKGSGSFDLGFDGDRLEGDGAEDEASSLGGIGQGFGVGGGGRASGGPTTKTPAPEKKAAEEAQSQAPPAPKPAATAAPTIPPATAARPADASDPFSPGWNGTARRPPPPPPRERGLVPMRKVFDRKASFVAGNNLVSELASTAAEIEAAQKAAPDSRDKTVALFKLLLATGRVGEAQELTARWAERDALDADALFARADLAAMSGDRERAIRILSGIADVRPGDKTMQTRLVTAFTQLGAREVACQQRMSLADIDLTEVNNVASAVKCSRDLGFTRVASAFIEGVDPQKRDAVEVASRTVKLEAGPVTGDTRISATWAGGGDLDFALIDKNGRRFSWLGSPLKTVSVLASDASSTRNETVGFTGLQQGNYVIEVTRATPSNQPVSGEVTLTLPGGETRKVPFNLTSNREELGSLRVFFTSRLVPVDASDFGSFGWRR